jgi:ElaB/YqjD/DUF883 family membrane-anchored ribosome-binding protein
MTSTSTTNNEHQQAAAPPEPFKQLTERLGPKLDEVTAQLDETNERVKAFIKKNPGTCLLGAAALGFMIGKWASRR